MNYAKIKWFDIANGPGVRASLFVSGCTHKCPGCFNEEAQDFNYGNPWTKEIEDKFIEHLKKPEIAGVNILGGEPLQQVKDNSLLNLLTRIKTEVDKPIWLWTGYTWEQIIHTVNETLNEKLMLTIGCVDVLIDGLFIEKEKDLSLLYRGSRNQRVIDVKSSLRTPYCIDGVMTQPNPIEIIW